MNIENENSSNIVNTEVVIGNETQLEETLDPFARRESITRSPPRSRSFSVPNFDFKSFDNQEQECILTEEKPSKRKRIDDEPERDVKNQKEITNVFRNALEEIVVQVEYLERIVRAAYKPKKEYTGISSKLTLQVEKLKSKAIKEWLDKTVDVTRTGNEYTELRQENERLLKKICHMEAVEKIHQDKLLPSAQNSDVKCIECLKEQKQRYRKYQLKNDESYTNFQAVSEEEWHDELFEKPDVKQGFIWEAPLDWDIILPCAKNIESKHKEIEKAIEKFGGKEMLQKQNRTEGEVAIMSHTLGFPDNKGNFNRITRWIHFPILSEKSNSSDEDDKLLFQSLSAIKSRLIKEKKYRVAIPEVEDVRGTVIIRMLQYLVSDTPIKLDVYRQDKRKSNPLGERRGQIKSTRDPQNSLAERPKKPKSDAIIVRMENKSYSEMLRTLKSAINPSELGVDITSIKKTKNDELLLTVKNGLDKAIILESELKGRIPDAKATLLVSQKIIHVKGMDEVTTVEEIREAVSKSIGIRPETFEVRALRPAYGGTQNVTIKLKEVDANLLIQKKTIKIGWTNCMIQERKPEMRCFGCWEYGHVRGQCSGPDRGQLCLRCGQEGHMISQCRNKPFCVFCKQEGHQSNNRKCQSNTNKERDGPSEQGQNSSNK